VATVRIDAAAVERLVRDEDGPVGRDLDRRAARVQGEARRLVRKRTRRLHDSIIVRETFDPRGQARVIGSPLDYARWEHDGTRKHLILPKRTGGRLAFYWPKVGRRVAFRKVNHPGTRGTKFLVRALPAAGD
jgi:hypothetical protein